MQGPHDRGIEGYALAFILYLVSTTSLYILFREWQLHRLASQDADLTEDASKMYVQMTGTGGPHQSWTLQLPDNVTESTEGYLHVHQHSKISPRRVKASIRQQFKRNSRETSNTVISVS